MTLTSLEPEFIVDPQGAIHTGVLVLENGNKISKIQAKAPPSSKRILLKGKMLLPGFVNVHSHALQRALRGRVETKHMSGVDNFWSWRTNMYKDVERASLDDLEAVATLAYLEMIMSGFVAVGEFNYLHHMPSGMSYNDPVEVSRRLVRAAERVGIRQTLLTCAYQRRNHKDPLLAPQARFIFKNASDFLSHAKQICATLSSPLLSHGIAIHSTRACSKDFIEEICQSGLAKQLPLHIHAAEQEIEVAESIEEYGLTPIEALQKFGALRSNTTLIHATHLTQNDISLIRESQAMVGLCPSTERNLGDGMCPIEDLIQNKVQICIGTDQHVRLDPVGELREIEEQERLRLRKRCVLANPGSTVAEFLLPLGHYNGRKSLGISLSNKWENEPADLVAIQLPVSYEFSGPTVSLNQWMVSGTHHDVTDVFINGRQLISDRLPIESSQDIYDNANQAIKRLVS